MLLNLTEERLVVPTLEMLLDRVTQAVGLVLEAGTLKVLVNDVCSASVIPNDPIEDFKQVLLCDLLVICCHYE